MVTYPSESAGFLVVLAVFKTVVASRQQGVLGSIPSLSDPADRAVLRAKNAE